MTKQLAARHEAIALTWSGLPRRQYTVEMQPCCSADDDDRRRRYNSARTRDTDCRRGPNAISHDALEIPASHTGPGSTDLVIVAVTVVERVEIWRKEEQKAVAVL